MEPQCPNTALLSEARRLRNLGRYPEAESKFREAITAQDEIDLQVELASMFAEQGKVRKCYEQLANLTAKSELSPAGRMLLCVADAGISVQLAPNLETAVSLYNAHLLRRRPEDYEKLHVPLLCTYLGLINLAELCGADTASAPLPSLESFNQLFRHLVKENRLQAALSVARLYAAKAIPSKATFLLQELLGHAVPLTAGTDGATDADCNERLLLRADVMMELTDWLKKAGKKKEQKIMISGAAQLYERAGHATGSAMAEVYGFDVAATKTVSHRKQQRERLLAIKDKLERFEYYEGVRSALGALYNLAMADKDHEFLATLDSEYRRISETRGFLLDVSTSSQITISRWTRTGALTAEMLQTYEALYETTKSQEAPLIRAMIASSLGGGYDNIGDTAKAIHWKELAAQEPPAVQSKHSGFLYGQDPFYRSLEEQRAPLPDGEEEERRRLLQELGRMEEYMCLDCDAISPELLHHGIMKLLSMCDLYLGQIGFRGTEGCEIMTRTCLEHSDRFTALLTPNERMEWNGKVLQRQARLSFTIACTRGPSPGVPDLAMLARSTEQYNEARDILGRAGVIRDQAMVSQNLYSCYKLAWQQGGRQPLSPLFGHAVECLEEPVKALRAYNNVASERLNRSFLFGLWAEGLIFRVEHGRMRPLWRWLGLGLFHRVGRYLSVWRWLPQSIQNLRSILFTTPLEEAASALEQAERLIDEERQNLSALPGKAAILAKQHLRKNGQVVAVFQQAPVVFFFGNEAKPLWQWVQRSKARSISDLLGIGNIIPSDLAERINNDPTASSMLTAEIEIVKGVNTSTGADQFAARRRLDLHRRKMRNSNPHLAELLDLREGKPVEWEELARLAEQDTSTKPRRTWFVDWVVANGIIFLILVSDEKEFYHVEQLDMNVAAVTEWIQKHLDDAQGQPLERALNIEDTSLEALLEIQPLVGHITTLTAEGDRLVLCPSGPLHRVPLHAAIVKGNLEDDPDDRAKEWQTLIERNPTVYASSLTIYKQNMTRRLARGVTNPLARGGSTALGVYEEPANAQNSPGWKTERAEVYKTCNGIASMMGWEGGARCGKAVGKPEMAAALQSGGAMLYFCGHFHEEEGKNVLDCGLLLGRADGESEDVQRASVKKPLLTTSELLETKVTTPHVTLIACGSAKQKIDAGDEPLGVVTALLYAGATSVMGTMWPINSGDGREFSETFFGKVKNLEAGEDEVVDLAVVLQATVKKLRRGEETSRPYCWAGFVLNGCWCL